MIAIRVKINRVKRNFDVDATAGPLAFNREITIDNLGDYELFLRTKLYDDPVFLENFLSLAGQNIGCTCELSQECHVDIIIKVLEEKVIENVILEKTL